MEKEEFLYQEIFEALNKAKINYLVCGGAAVVLFGSPRMTADLDLIVSLDKENLENLYNVLIKLGYALKIPIKKEDFIQKETLQKLAKEKNMKVVSFYNLKDPFEIIDIGVNLPGIPEILKNKKYITVKNSDIPIISMDDLIKMKKAVARPKDLIDVENLEKIKKYEKENN
ncbi:MAG: hypothetical protein Q8Q96_01110 [bacterium]|nr:hypothetical protein [bacterium]